MNYVGDYNPGQIVYIYFNTFDSNDPSASVTITNFINTDVHIHKDDSLTQRNNAAGVTVDVDVDAITGTHFIKIDTSDNTVDDFFVAGHDYFVRIEGTTVDAATVNAVVGSFSLGNRAVAGWMNSSAIATLASQTSFTLSQGSADNSAYVNCTIVVTDQATTVQKCIGRISAYTGATKTVTLAADPGIFTMAAGDNVQIFASSAFANVDSWLGTLVTSGTGGPDVNVNAISDDTTAPQNLELMYDGTGYAGGTANFSSIDVKAISGDATAADNAELFFDGTGYAGGTTKLDVNVASEDNIDFGATKKASINTEVDNSMVTYGLDHLVSAAVIGTDVTDNSIVAKLVDDAATADWDGYDPTTASLEALNVDTDAIVNDTDLIDDGTSGLAKIATDVAAVLVDTGTTLDAALATVDSNVDAILVDTGTTLDGRIPAALVGGRMDADVGAISTSTDAADKLEASAEILITGAAEAGTLSTTQMTTDLAEATNEHYNGRIVIWTSGVLLGQASDITAYLGSTGRLTYTAVTEAPSATDTFVIV